MNNKPSKLEYFFFKSPGRYFLLSVVLFVIALVKIYLDIFSSNVSLRYGGEKAYVLIGSHDGAKEVYAKFEKAYYLNNNASFHRLANLLNLDEKIRPGRYLIEKGMSNYDLLRILLNGRQEPLNVVLKYEERPEDIAGFFSRYLETDSLEFLHLLKDTAVIHPLGFDTQNVVAMFVPNTYNFYWNTHATAIIERMHREYKKFWTEERLQQALQVNLTPVEVSILASIVQKESNKGDEMPIIAGTYLNRLKKGMPLQADPTVIFAWNDKSIKRVTNIHTALPSSYNTYLNKGLPPGPICTPSIQAIDAVLNYDHNEYLYFCAKEDFSGYHAFAKSFEQHQQNARRYQHALNLLKIQ